MPFNLEDRIREMERELQEMRSQLGRVPTRPATPRLPFSIIRCQAKGAASGATFTVDNIVLVDGIDPRADPTDLAEELTITNPDSLEFNDDDHLWASYSPDAGQWWPLSNVPGDSAPGDESLFADFTVTTESAWNDATVVGDISAYWGGTPGSTTGVTVYKIPNQAVPMFIGDKFRAVWDTTRNRWEMFWYPGLRITVKAVTDAGGSTVTPSTANFTVSALSQLLVNGWRLPAIELTVTNNPPVYLEPGSEVYVRFNLQAGVAFASHWDTGDMRNFLPALKGIGGWAAGGAFQAIIDQAADDPEWETFDSYDGASPKTQVMGHQSGNLQFNGMCSLALGQASAAVTSGDASFTGNTFTVLCGISPGTSKTIQNHFGFNIDAGGKILVVRKWDADTWYCVQAECP